MSFPSYRLDDIRAAHIEEIPAIARLLSQAFYNDPVYQWLFPVKEIRLQKCQHLFTVFLENLVPLGTVSVTPELEGAALWIPPAKGRDWLKGVKQNLAILWILGGSILRGIRWWLTVESKHPNYPHWYLFLLGVKPEFQRRGVGSALLRPMLEKCDKEQIPVYLDTGNEKNIAFYERQGFRVMNRIDLVRGLSVIQMVRVPGTK